MGSHNNGNPLRKRTLVHNDDPPQEQHLTPKNRRHFRRLPHPRRRRPARRLSHRPFRRAHSLQPFPPRHQLPRRHIRRLGMDAAGEAARRRRLCHRVEHRGDVDHMRLDSPRHPTEDVRRAAGDRGRRRSQGGGVRPVGRRRVRRQSERILAGRNSFATGTLSSPVADWGNSKRLKLNILILAVG
ncbi:unnamed protein product [Cuscuta epithymum]|uniref:Uncharacterized protein n=1 Tax=Cuscuta epithymum TaxID=186058 RepID=A0AAV0C7U3_9ASTE|nr:unnamed protein product [Cuscuta epithymum]